MKTIRFDSLSEAARAVICLGRVGEKDRTRVEIGCGEVLAEYPGATAGLAVKNPAGAIYPGVVSLQGDAAVWAVQAGDLTENGYGEGQLTFFGAGGEIVKTALLRTVVYPSLIPTQQTAPEPAADGVTAASALIAFLTQMTQLIPNITFSSASHNGTATVNAANAAITALSGPGSQSGGQASSFGAAIFGTANFG